MVAFPTIRRVLLFSLLYSVVAILLYFNVGVPAAPTATHVAPLCSAMQGVREAASILPTSIQKIAGVYSAYLHRQDVKVVVECGTRSPLTTVLLFEALESRTDTSVFTVDRLVNDATIDLYKVEHQCAGVTKKRARAIELMTLDSFLLFDEDNIPTVDMLVLHNDNHLLPNAQWVARNVRTYVFIHEVFDDSTIDGMRNKMMSYSKNLRQYLLASGNWNVELYVTETHDRHYVLRRASSRGDCRKLNTRKGSPERKDDSAINKALENNKEIKNTARGKCLTNIEVMRRFVKKSTRFEALKRECLTPTGEWDRSVTKLYSQLVSVYTSETPTTGHLPLIFTQLTTAKRFLAQPRVLFWGCDSPAILLVARAALAESVEVYILDYFERCKEKEYSTDVKIVTELVPHDVLVIPATQLSTLSNTRILEISHQCKFRVIMYDTAFADVNKAAFAFASTGFTFVSCFTCGTGIVVMQSYGGAIPVGKTVELYESNVPNVRRYPLFPTALQPTLPNCTLLPLMSCSLPHCIVLNARCTSNAFYRLPQKFDPEGQCTRRSFRGDPLPVPTVSSLQNAQYYGSWLFRRWTNFQSTCTSGESGEMSGRHEPSNQLYTIKNFCVRPMGKITGFRPVMETYRGEDEAYYLGFKRSLASFQEWIQDVESTPSAPSCFYDTPVILFPITTGSDDPQRSFHRAGSLLQLVKAAFPENANNVTIIYVVMKEGMNTAHSTFSRQKANPVSFYYQMVSRSHMTVVGYDDADESTWSSLNNTFVREQWNIPVCFKVGYAWYNVRTDMQRLGASTEPGRQAQFSLYGARSTQDKHIMHATINELSKCFNFERREKPNTSNPHVLLSISKAHVLAHSGDVVQELAEAVQSVGGSLAVIEDTDLSAEEFASRYSLSDIVISTSGRTSFWHVLSPAGSALVELSIDNELVSGVNRNRISGSGGDAYTAGMNHFVYKIPNKLQRMPLGSWEGALPAEENSIKEFILPPVLFSELFRVAHCLISNQRSCALEESTAENTNTMNRFLLDEEGYTLEYVSKKLSTSLFPFDVITRNKLLVSKVLRPFRQTGHAARVLEILPRMCHIPDYTIGHFLLLHYYLPNIIPTQFTATESKCRDVKGSDRTTRSFLKILKDRENSRVFEYFRQYNCSGPLNPAALSRCAVVGGKQDIIVVDGSLPELNGNTELFTELYFLLEINGSLIIPHLKCADVMKSLEGPLETAIECGEKLTIVRKTKSTDNDVLFHIKALLLSGEDTNNPARIPALGYIIKCGEMHHFKENVRTLAAPVGRIILLLRCNDEHDVAFLKFLRGKLTKTTFLYFVQPSLTMPVAHNFILRTAFQRDIAADHTVLCSPKLTINRNSIINFSSTANSLINEGKYVGQLALHKNGETLISIPRFSSELIGIYDESFEEMSDAVVEFELRQKSAGLIFFRPFGEKAHEESPCRRSEKKRGSQPPRSLKEANQTQKVSKYLDPCTYLNIKWGTDDVSQSPYTCPFAVPSLYHSDGQTLIEESNYIRCLNTGVGERDSCGRCKFDFIARLQESGILVPGGIPGNIIQRMEDVDQECTRKHQK